MNSYVTAAIAAAIAAAVGFGAGYQVNSMATSTKISELESKVTELETKASELEAAAAAAAKLEVPTDEEATAALQKSTFKGSTMKISECQKHPIIPGVICNGVVSDSSGWSMPKSLPFAKIDGHWTYAK